MMLGEITMTQTQAPQNSKRVVDYLLTQIPVTTSEKTVGEVLDLIRRKKNWESINYIYVLDAVKKLIGVVAIKELMRAKDDSLIENIMTRNPAGVTASSPQEKAAVTAIQYKIKAVPILKPHSREFLGIVGTDKILEILHKEHVEDFLKFSGIAKSHPTVDILKASSFKVLKVRLPWLLVGIVGGILSVFLVGQFEPVLKKAIALSFFIPVVVYISNAVALQSQALLIRKLASGEVKVWKFLRKEIYLSLWLGLISALIIFIFAGWWLNDWLIALTVGLSIFVSTVVAVIIATSTPLILYQAKKDPALGSGPFATSVQDITTLLIYFLIALIFII